MLCLPNVARTVLLDLLTGNLDAYVHLYVNDTPIVQGLTLDDLSELSAPGYAPVNVPTWTPATLTSGIAYTWGDPILFTLTGPVEGGGQVYGYYVTQGSAGDLLWAERGQYPPYPMLIAGDRLMVLPALSLPQLPGQSCPPGQIGGGSVVFTGTFEIPP